MGNDQLRHDILRQADDDHSLSEQARLVILAALEAPEDLSEVLGQSSIRPQLVAPLTTSADVEGTPPAGAYLRSISVQGFRGIGPKMSVPLQPGPGLIVIAGRNGSGKSTLAEALEVALTGKNSRWNAKGQVWSRNWRNLHAGEPAEIRIGIAEEGSGTTTIGVDWGPGTDVVVEDMKTWVQRNGQAQESISVLGWSAALEMYRPLLSYDELGQILEGRPSDFHDQLYKLLGLEQLTDALAVLDDQVKALKQPAVDAKKAKEALKPRLEGHSDPRAAAALAQVTRTKPKVEAVRPLITDGAASAVPPAWQQAQRLTCPTADEVRDKCVAMRSAAKSEREEIKRSDVLAADRSRLLEMSLAFHENHGDQQCPVCSKGTLNEEWAVAARAALEQDQTTATNLAAARSATQHARSTLVEIARSVPRPPLAEAELTTLAAASIARERFAELPIDDDLALADHVEATLPELEHAYAAVRQEATNLIKAREEAWGPVAMELAEWVRKAELAGEAEPKLKVASEALKWLQKNAGQLRNQRMAPLAQQATKIWEALRQESNVALGAIRLEGQKTSRRVVLEAAVDGSEAEAFGVMSQGELQALALAIFIPRATSLESPFRFLVLDDPIQAMDPSKIDGFLQVLTDLAKDRQIIVLTHDDRLPAAIRRSRAPARIIEVTRAPNSAVAVSESTRPAARLLDDAYAIAADAAVPDAIKKAAIPVLCREAFEATAWDVFASRALAQGQCREDVEAAWEHARNTRRRVTIAVDANDDSAIEKWIGGGSARKAAMLVATKGIHAGVHDFRAAVKATRQAVDDLRAMAQ
ncbi:SMC domain protein [Mycolicibacterium rhodesiae JS60]|nr:SMC domain protein [Mycolicibacterium rhodesiae JS60]